MQKHPIDIDERKEEDIRLISENIQRSFPLVNERVREVFSRLDECVSLAGEQNTLVSVICSQKQAVNAKTVIINSIVDNLQQTYSKIDSWIAFVKQKEQEVAELETAVAQAERLLNLKS